MKILSVLLLLFIQVYGFSQSYEEREAITQKFSQTNPEIILTEIASDTSLFAELMLKSAYLESQKITPEIIGFRISGTDNNSETLFLSEMIHQNSIPQTTREKLKN